MSPKYDGKDGMPVGKATSSAQVDMATRNEASFLSQLLLLTPFFLLHAGSGLLGGFTSIQLQHFIELEENVTSPNHHETGVFETGIL